MKKTKSVEKIIKDIKKSNGGKQPEFVCSNGFQMDFTPENYKKVQEQVEKMYSDELQKKSA